MLVLGEEILGQAGAEKVGNGSENLVNDSCAQVTCETGLRSLDG